MKKIYLLFVFTFYGFFANAQNPDAFIVTYEVTNDIGLGVVISIPNNSSNNFTVDFGDGTVLTNQTGYVPYSYQNEGIYTVTITGTFNRLHFGNTFANSNLKLKSIEQWGTNQWQTMKEAFKNCVNLVINATDNPDLSQVVSVSNMFENTTSFNQSINHWDVSQLTNLSKMFYGATSFNQSLNDWDVSNATNMSEMFEGAASFNQSLNNWDVSNVSNMTGMFKNATSFNQPLNNWNISNLWGLPMMFEGASSFNQPLNDWDVSNLSYLYRTFANAISFNQPLNNWNVTNVTNMNNMFYGATSFNQSLASWNFNENISFQHLYPASSDFASYSGLDSTNYDLLLQRFITLQIQDKTVRNDGLKYCNQENRSFLINNLSWNLYGDSLSENCTNNSIVGKILFDENNNGCDTDDNLISNILVMVSNDSLNYSTLSFNGEYILNHLQEDNYTVSLANVPSYVTVNPQSSTVFLEGVYNEEELNFCLTANQTIEDLNITLLPITEARPGFEADYQLIVQNIGTQTVNNVLVSLDFDNTMQSFVSADPSTSSTTANQLNFEIASLPPFGSTVINFTMQTFTPPTVDGDDILNFTATVSPNTDDYTPNDNTFELEQIVVNSYDPNDKQVLQGNEIDIDDVNEYLHYLIRFQNTGTASAIHVRIEDELHESLDWNTIQILNSSHNYRVEIKDGNQVAFIFNNINLPYEDEDEEGSNGFIAYKIKPIAGTQLGDFIIGNEAYIYFDYNLPIITNTTSTEVVEDTSSVSVPSLNNLISVYPNPTNGILHLSSKENIIIEEVKIYNLQGRELFGSTTNQQTINIENLSAGIYLMNIKTNQGSISKRVIKK